MKLYNLNYTFRWSLWVLKEDDLLGVELGGGHDH